MVTARTIVFMVNERRADQPTPMDFSILLGKSPPPRIWWHGHWLNNAPTLCSGSGGIGKSFLLQALLTALATGNDYLGADSGGEPLRALGWFCEDDHDDLGGGKSTSVLTSDFHSIMPMAV